MATRPCRLSSSHFRNLADLPFDFELPESQFLLRKVEELSKRYIFFALLQLFVGLFLIVSPLSISVFLLNIIGLIFLILGFQSFSLLLKVKKSYVQTFAFDKSLI